MRFTFQIALILVIASCGAPPPTPPAEVEVKTWGTMREVLREGRSGGRVALTALGSHDAVGVGAMANLTGEVTVLDGRVLVAEGEGSGREGVPIPRVRNALPGDSASLLVLARVSAWDEVSVRDCASYEDLETVIAEHLRERGDDLAKPTPVRIRGRATHLALHVIAGACPIANPSGPRPWRFSGPLEDVELVGIYVEGASGRLTHHDRSSHLHAVADEVMGHLDGIALEDAVLLLPATR